MLEGLGPEFTILREVPLEDIQRAAGPLVAEGIRRLRSGRVARKPGYDGAYGVIQLLSPAEREVLRGQVSLFGAEAPRQAKSAKGQVSKSARGSRAKSAAPAGELNGEQKAAVTATEPTVAVIAGPGTGKTHTLVERAAWLVEERKAKPAELTAITFTNRAAEELRARLEKTPGEAGGPRHDHRHLPRRLPGAAGGRAPGRPLPAAGGGLRRPGGAGPEGEPCRPPAGHFPVENRHGHTGGSGLRPLPGEAGRQAGL